MGQVHVGRAGGFPRFGVLSARLDEGGTAPAFHQKAPAARPSRQGGWARVVRVETVVAGSGSRKLDSGKPAGGRAGAHRRATSAARKEEGGVNQADDDGGLEEIEKDLELRAGAVKRLSMSSPWRHLIPHRDPRSSRFDARFRAGGLGARRWYDFRNSGGG